MSTTATGLGYSDGRSGDVSLLEYLDLSQLSCLNEASSNSLKPVISSKSSGSSGLYLLSDADEQLLLNITFNQAVRVRSISIRSANVAQAPKKLKLLVNRPSLGFEDVEFAEEPEIAQAIELSEEDVRTGKHVALRYVRFQAVNSLHIFVASNHGGEEETRIDKVDILGVPVETTKDLSELRNRDDTN